MTISVDGRHAPPQSVADRAPSLTGMREHMRHPYHLTVKRVNYFQAGHP